MVFTYSNYISLLKNINNSEKYLDYSMVNDKTDSFIVMRHDVEFSLKKALTMALIEKKHCIVSSYFIQLQNDFYNAISYENLEIIKKIVDAGHHIGLHYHLNNKKNIDISSIKDDIKYQCQILSNYSGTIIDRFSIHKPTQELLAANINIDGLINVYGTDYFSHVPNYSCREDQNLKIKYFADSRIEWKYGVPTKLCINEYKKIQLLIHPYSWFSTEKDYSTTSNATIIDRIYDLINVYDNEQK